MSEDGRCLFRLHASIVILDSRRRVLLVQEQKANCRGKWNLPGGHVDHGENVVASALREAVEETHLVCEADAFVGVYTHAHAIRFVVLSERFSGTAQAGDEIMAVRWVSLDDAVALPPRELVGNTAQVLRDVLDGRTYPLDVVSGIVTP
jgi:8-oxo-dGTP diphosphatase